MKKDYKIKIVRRARCIADTSIIGKEHTWTDAGNYQCDGVWAQVCSPRDSTHREPNKGLCRIAPSLIWCERDGPCERHSISGDDQEKDNKLDTYEGAQSGPCILSRKCGACLLLDPECILCGSEEKAIPYISIHGDVLLMSREEIHRHAQVYKIEILNLQRLKHCYMQPRDRSAGCADGNPIVMTTGHRSRSCNRPPIPELSFKWDKVGAPTG